MKTYNGWTEAEIKAAAKEPDGVPLDVWGKWCRGEHDSDEDKLNELLNNYNNDKDLSIEIIDLLIAEIARLKELVNG